MLPINFFYIQNSDEFFYTQNSEDEFYSELEGVTIFERINLIFYLMGVFHKPNTCVCLLSVLVHNFFLPNIQHLKDSKFAPFFRSFIQSIMTKVD